MNCVVESSSLQALGDEPSFNWLQSMGIVIAIMIFKLHVLMRNQSMYDSTWNCAMFPVFDHELEVCEPYLD